VDVEEDFLVRLLDAFQIGVDVRVDRLEFKQEVLHRVDATHGRDEVIGLCHLLRHVLHVLEVGLLQLFVELRIIDLHIGVEHVFRK